MAKNERDLSTEDMLIIQNDTNKRIFDLIQSTDVNDKLAGITAIGNYPIIDT